MTFDEYRLADRARYAALVDAVRQVLKAAVDAAGMAPHAITGRAKDPDSLAKKLVERGIDRDADLAACIKDLAGARVVFLTNAQVQRFLGSGIIRENFDVISVNVHHAVPDTETETRLFSSTNYFVQLKDTRLSLPEYAPFAGMRAEIQVQTLLNHAWAEMDHDTFYKEPAFRHVDRPQFERIKQRMDAVMTDHLLPAGHDLDKISRDMALLMRAEEAYEPSIATIRTAKSNDELSAALETLDDIVMPRLAERRQRFLDMLPALADAVKRARAVAPARIDTALGPFDGETGLDVARKFATLLRHHRYCDPERTLATLFELDEGADADERKLWAEQGAEFAAHDLDVWRSHGPAVQRIVVDGIAALPPDAASRSRRLVLGMLGKVLSCDVGGTRRGAEVNTLVINQGTVAPSDELGRVRSDAVSLLERMLAEARIDADRGEILNVMREAARPPFHGGSAALRRMVMTDAARTLAIERAIAPDCGLELRRRMEVAALHVHHWFGAVPKEMADDGELVGAQRAVIGEINELRDQLNGDDDFRAFKIVIGHDSVWPQAWTGDPFDYAATDEWRIGADADLLALIDREGADGWIARVRRYLAEPIAPGDGGPLAGFTTRLAGTRPWIVLRIVDEVDERLLPLLLPSLVGLDRAGREDAAHSAAVAWVAEGRFLEHVAHWLGSRTKSDPSLLVDVAAAARMRDDRPALVACANAAARLWAAGPDRRLSDDVFMPTVDHFASVGDTGWVRQAWDVRQGSLVPSLEADQSRRLLASFAVAPDIDYDAERILTMVAGDRPDQVIDFFAARIARERDGDGAGFEPIPFRLRELQAPLARQPDLLLRAARRWHEIDPSLHQFRGGRLIGNVFPDLPAELAERLAAIIRDGDRPGLEFVLDTLVVYDGIDGVYPICMDAVDRLDEGDTLLGKVSGVLGETGMVEGEFGHVQAEARQRAALERYVDDPRPKVSAFARDARHRAAQSMAWEQRRAEQEVEQMRRDWD